MVFFDGTVGIPRAGASNPNEPPEGSYSGLDSSSRYLLDASANN